LREETDLSLPAQPDPSRARRLPAAARRNIARATLPAEPHIPVRCSAFLPAAHLHSIEAERALPLLQPATRRLACLCSGRLLHLACLELSNLLACGSDLPSAGSRPRYAFPSRSPLPLFALAHAYIKQSTSHGHPV